MGWFWTNKWISIPNEGMDVTGVVDGEYEVRGPGVASLHAVMRSGMWFFQGKPLWFRPSEYRRA